MDYSAANEYIAAHYPHVHSKEYFASIGQASEPIYDGRVGVWDDDAVATVPASLASCGFAMQPSPTSVTNWADADAVRSDYLPQLREQLTALVEGSAAHGKVAELIFWHPVLRGEAGWEEEGDDGATQEGGEGGGVARSGYVALAHVDTDVNAYAEQPAATLAHLVRSNGRALTLSPAVTPALALLLALILARTLAPALARALTLALGPVPGPGPLLLRAQMRHMHYARRAHGARAYASSAQQRRCGAGPARSDARRACRAASGGAPLLHHQLLAQRGHRRGVCMAWRVHTRAMGMVCASLLPPLLMMPYACSALWGALRGAL